MNRQLGYSTIVVHHSASPLMTTFDEIRGWHLKRGFSEIGYHWVITGVGLILRGRSPLFVPAAQKGANLGSLAICVVGDNTVPEHSWTPVQLASLRELVYCIQRIYGPLKLYGHRDAPGLLSPTECPGVNVRALVWPRVW